MKLNVIKSGNPSISSRARLSRKDTHSSIVVLPLDIKAEIDRMIEGGSFAAALSGLIIYGMEQLKKNGERLVLSED